MTVPFGRLLRHWRRVRGQSQLDLSHRAEVSPRHISFLENGRSRAGEAVVLRLARALDVDLPAQNELLRAAGLPERYHRAGSTDARIRPYRRVIDLMLGQHEPYPCFVIDADWNLHEANTAARRFFGAQPPLSGQEVLATIHGPGPVRAAMVNWVEVAWHTLDRLRRESRAAGFPASLDGLVAQLEGYLQGVRRPPAAAPDAVALCPIFDIDGRRVHVLATITRVGAAIDVGLDALRIEHVFPADDDSAAYFREQAQCADDAESGQWVRIPSCDLST